MRKRALTALQPTNILHIGNLFGGLLPLVEAQREFQTFLMVVDYHAITVPQDPTALRENILFATAAYLAAGVDPARTILFQQSLMPEHTELAWILNCLARMGELERMTQFKDKAAKQKTGVSVGLFTYPVLMAADILLYDINVVPVGADQKQHVELARDLAERFNRQFGETFVVPEPQIRKSGARLMSLDNPREKMSKSSKQPKSFISLMDEPEMIRKKIAAAVTDSGVMIVFDQENKPALSNLITIMALLKKQTTEQIERDYTGRDYSEFKKDLAELLVLYLLPLQAEIKGWLKNRKKLIGILKDGAEQAQKIAGQKMKMVRERIGIR